MPRIALRTSQRKTLPGSMLDSDNYHLSQPTILYRHSNACRVQEELTSMKTIILIHKQTRRTEILKWLRIHLFSSILMGFQPMALHTRVLRIRALLNINWYLSFASLQNHFEQRALYHETARGGSRSTSIIIRLFNLLISSRHHEFTIEHHTHKESAQAHNRANPRCLVQGYTPPYGIRASSAHDAMLGHVRRHHVRRHGVSAGLVREKGVHCDDFVLHFLVHVL